MPSMVIKAVRSFQISILSHWRKFRGSSSVNLKLALRNTPYSGTERRLQFVICDRAINGTLFAQVCCGISKETYPEQEVVMVIATKRQQAGFAVLETAVVVLLAGAIMAFATPKFIN